VLKILVLEILVLKILLLKILVLKILVLLWFIGGRLAALIRVFDYFRRIVLMDLRFHRVLLCFHWRALSKKSNSLLQELGKRRFMVSMLLSLKLEVTYAPSTRRFRVWLSQNEFSLFCREVVISVAH
jgi:hypothetical protein